VVGDLSFNLILRFNGFYCFYPYINLIKFSEVFYEILQANTKPHTCTLRGAMKLNITKISRASYQNMINAYKNKICIKLIPTFTHIASGPELI
jgi:hypothetical protein